MDAMHLQSRTDNSEQYTTHKISTIEIQCEWRKGKGYSGILLYVLS